MSVDVAELCAELIRFDTSNFGEGKSHGEHKIAEFIAQKLEQAGYQPMILGPNLERSSVLLRVPGTERHLPGLLVHAHLDVVPAEAEQWSRDPFSGLIEDGYIHGRGACDMKDMVAMTMVTLLNWAESGLRPRRDIVVAFVADEEDKGDYGAGWLVDEHPELFAGVQAAIGESGGTANLLTAQDGSSVRLYPVAAAERGTLHIRVRAEGNSGHGSRPVEVNAVKNLIAALQRVGVYRWPLKLTPVVRGYLEQTTAALGFAANLESEEGVAAAIEAMGEAGEVARVTVRCSSTPTVLRAGYKVNVIPGVAEADIDIRCLPGTEESTLETIDGLLGPGLSRSFIAHEPPTNSAIDSPWFESMKASLLRHDPAAVVVPYCMGGGTDAKAFSKLGISCYGFSPLTADPEGRSYQGVHGVDERIPVHSVRGGQQILQDFLSEV
ncbi:acetylornithine deacetylase/succinyl-diaminopimelate desuccinylase-like protein [Psychromicrobium silvestre]|uniref:Acetylornithine deacetylase/succinyl-diaminopimelate desuccinylase-like protein n=1 Tax=Psychromicrobium silvestre TaxID=1645614 RepID=A0A7Y9S8X0_9MICC|nr:acetylornithine deacetylase/succinyl-diaminopimelate desuccinylase-like protein [Psychromicrobium silvestre]